MIDPDYDINKPIRDKNMLIFNNTAFQPLLEIPYTCNRSISSLCYDNINITDCIEKCRESDECSAGFHILNKNTNKTICIPIRTSVYKDYNFAQDLYDTENISNEYKITSFIKSDIKYPPNELKYIYYRDIFRLKNVETSTYLSTKKTGTKITFENVSNVMLSCVSFETFYSKITNKKIRYGDKISFMQDETSYILSFDSLKNINWKQRLSPNLSVNEEFIILNNKKHIGDEVGVNDEFYLQNNLGEFMTVNNGVFMLDSHNEEQLRIMGIGYMFMFENKNKLYICENSNCRELTPFEMDYVIQNGDYSYYKDNIVFKDARCSGYCKIEDVLNVPVIEKYTKLKRKKSNNVLIIILLLILLIYILR